MNKLLIGWAIGLFFLLIACASSFDGPLAPAVWQLTGTIWMFIWWKHVEKTDEN